MIPNMVHETAKGDHKGRPYRKGIWLPAASVVQKIPPKKASPSYGSMITLMESTA